MNTSNKGINQEGVAKITNEREGILPSDNFNTLVNNLGTSIIKPKFYHKDTVAICTKYLGELIELNEVNEFVVKSIILGERIFVTNYKNPIKSREEILALNIITQRHFNDIGSIIKELYGSDLYQLFLDKKDCIDSQTHGFTERLIPEHFYKGAKQIMRSVEYQENEVISNAYFNLCGF